MRPPAWNTLPTLTLPNESGPIRPDRYGRTAVGIVVAEEDGRVWLSEPEDRQRGRALFPRRFVPRGYTPQQAARLHAYEALGLEVELADVLAEIEVGGIVTRFYLARRIGGAPWDFQHVSRAVHLVSSNRAGALLSKPLDRQLLRRIRSLEEVS
jgi:hypothetical protein